MEEVPQAAILVVEVTVLAVAEDLEVVEAGEKVRKVPNVRKISNLLLISTTYQIFSAIFTFYYFKKIIL